MPIEQSEREYLVEIYGQRQIIEAVFQAFLAYLTKKYSLENSEKIDLATGNIVGRDVPNPDGVPSGVVRREVQDVS